MTHNKLTPCALAVATALLALAPAAIAQSNEDLLKELRALRQRVDDLETLLKAAPAAKPGGAAASAGWGMTPQQVQDFNRIAVKTEALEDAVESQGLKTLKIAASSTRATSGTKTSSAPASSS